MKAVKKLTAFLLAIAMFTQLLPSTVLAADGSLVDEAAVEALEMTNDTLAESSEDAYTEALQNEKILFEETTLREESIKHFRLENGTYLAVSYDAPVHYRGENGKWIDFDNTLRPMTSAKDNEVTSYRVKNGNSQRIFASNANADDLLTLQKEDVSVAFSLECDKENIIPEEKKQSNSIRPEADEVIAAAVLDTASCGYVEGNSLLAQAQPDKIYSALEYKNAFGGETLRYENYGNTVKESIVIPAPQEDYSFSFRIETAGLKAELCKNGIVTFATDSGEIVYYIPAPYLIDADNAISFDAEYILEGSDGFYTLTVTADSAWMNDKDRAFPVVLDPTITEGNLEDAKLTATYINSGYPGSAASNASGVYVGNNGNVNQMTNTLVHINELIDIPDGSEVTYASFSLSQFAYERQTGGLTSFDVGLYPMHSLNGNENYNIATSRWQNLMNVVTWNAVYGSNAYYVFDNSTLVTDFVTVSSATNNTYATWDITLLAKDWYKDPGKNLGFVLRPILPEDQVTARVSFYGPDTTIGTRPQMVVSYRNTVGIESQYSYQTAGIGRAGTAYISDATLHQTLDVPLISSPSDVMPFSLSLVYNSVYGNREFKNDSSMLHTKPYTNMNLGAGWKLSAQESVCSFTINNTTYLIYSDADGTEHYFYYVGYSGGYKLYRDEDGLGLKISVNGSNYTMSDDYGNTKYFGNGYLKQQYDAYGNYLYFNYNANAQLTSITRHNNGSSTTETLASFTYDPNTKRLTQISNEAGEIITFTYNQLATTVYSLDTITFPDNKKMQYSYTSGSNGVYRMTSAYDEEVEYGMEFGYSSEGTVSSFTEYVSSNRIYGATISAEKLSHNQTRYCYCEDNDEDDHTDDIYINKVLDATGRTINSYSTDYTKKHVIGVDVSTFTQNSGTSKQNNRLTANVSAGQQGVNLLDNASVENGDEFANAAYAWSKSTTGANIGNVAYLGNLSLGLNSSAVVTTPYYWQQSVTPDEDGEYTFSGYIRVPSAAAFENNGCVCLSLLDSTGNLVAKSEDINYSTESIGSGWVRLSVTENLTGGSTYRARFSAFNFTGAVYGDAFQLEQEKSAATFNIIEDGSFEHRTQINTSFSNDYWYKSGTASVVTPNDSNEVLFGENLLSLPAKSGNQRISRNIPVNVPLSSTFILSAWAKAAASPKSGATQATDGSELNSYFGLILRFYYSDGTNEAHYYPFDPYYRDWQYVQGIAVPQKTGNVTIESIAVVVAYEKNINSAYIDNISFRMEPVQTYRYDDNGNTVAATQSGAGSQSAIYSGVDLTQYTAANGTKTTYTYNGKHDVSTVSIGGATCTNNYDTSGNVLNSKLTANGETKYTKTSAVPTADHNHNVSSTDVNGNTATYEYDGNLEKVTKITDASGQETKYSYNEQNGRGTKVEQYDGEEIEQSKVAEVGYAYGNGMLTQLSRKTKTDGGSWEYQYYNFTYNDWGQRTTIKVGNQTLSTNVYEQKGGNLTRTTFGNEQYADYFYDEFDRLTGVNYNNGRYIHYYYNAEGAVAKIAYGDGTTPKGSYEFERDSLGRLIRSAEYDGGGNLIQRTEHNFDAYNRLSSQKWVLGSDSYSESYTYSDGESGDGSLSQMTTATGETLNYTYDALKRLQNVKAKDGSTTLFTTAYAYHNVSGNQTSTQVEFRNVRLGGSESGSLLEGKKYSYDAMGNIIMISQSTGNFNPFVTYEYDSQNQLTKETYYDGTGTESTNIKRIYTYTYDTAGNIQSEVKKVRNGRNAFTTSTKNYSYDNTADWKDVLRSVEVNGITYNISYDGSGNPIRYNNGSAELDMSWTNGRQLSYVGCYDEQWQVAYYYDANGIRASKYDDGIWHTYITQNGKVVRETIGSGNTAKTLDFIYDESGRPFALIYKNGTATPETYYYILNMQGDVVKLVHYIPGFEYVEAATYTYDAWGNILSSSGSMAAINPLRYRGYYYDTETGFYYLQSRYYDPVNHRFINADTYTTTDKTDAIAYNMYAYCLNQPLQYIDSNGKKYVAVDVGIRTGAVRPTSSTTEDIIAELNELLRANGAAEIPLDAYIRAMENDGDTGRYTAYKEENYIYVRDSGGYSFELFLNDAGVGISIVSLCTPVSRTVSVVSLLFAAASAIYAHWPNEEVIPSGEAFRRYRIVFNYTSNQGGYIFYGTDVLDYYYDTSPDGVATIYSVCNGVAEKLT